MCELVRWYPTFDHTACLWWGARFFLVFVRLLYASVATSLHATMTSLFVAFLVEVSARLQLRCVSASSDSNVKALLSLGEAPGTLCCLPLSLFIPGQ